MPSDQAILTFFFSIGLIFIYINLMFRKSSLLRIRRWRRLFPKALLINTVCFASIALYFYFQYWFITDDYNYFIGALTYKKGFFDIQNGNDFMYYISRPFRTYLDFDRASFHILWGALGFIGNLNFLYVLSKRIDFSNHSKNRDHLIIFYSLLCFPNFMVWGRIYGKDSLSLFLVSIYVIGAYHLLTDQKIKLRLVLLSAIPVLLLYNLRTHIATVAAMGLLAGFYFKSINVKRYKNTNSEILYKFLIPVVLTVLFAAGSIYSLQKLTKKESVSINDVQHSLIDATNMGASGGSATDVAESSQEDPNIIFSSKQIAINIFMLLFAPVPWQIRGFADGLAFLSNILLLLLLIRFGKQIDLTSVFQKYLVVVCSLLIILLSFMTGNVGLILRQKTIILPFLFLLLFSTKTKNADKSPANRDNLPKPRFNT